MLRPMEQQMLESRAMAARERCLRHGTEFLAVYGCPMCETEAERLGRAARVSGRARLYGETDTPLAVHDDDRVGRPEERGPFLPVIVAAVIFVGALLAGWFLGYYLKLWRY